MPLSMFSRARRSRSPERPENPLRRCAPPARGSHPTLQLASTNGDSQSLDTLLHTINSADRQQRRRSHVTVLSPSLPLPPTQLRSQNVELGRRIRTLNDGSEERGVELFEEDQDASGQTSCYDATPGVNSTRLGRPLTTLPRHREPILSLVPPVTIYSSEFFVQDQTDVANTTAGQTTQPQAENIADLLEEAVHETLSEESSASSPPTAKSKGKEKVSVEDAEPDTDDAQHSSAGSSFNPTVEEFRPTSNPSSSKSSPEPVHSDMCSSTHSSLDANAQEFIPGQSTSSNSSPRESQVIFNPHQPAFVPNSQRVPLMEERLDGSSDPGYMLPSTVFEGFPTRESSQQASNRCFAPDPHGSRNPVTDPSSAGQASARSSILPPLRYIPGCGFLPTTQQEFGTHQETGAAASLSPNPLPPSQAQFPPILIVNGSSPPSSVNGEQDMPEDTNRLRPSDAERIGLIPGLEIEEVRDAEDIRGYKPQLPSVFEEDSDDDSAGDPFGDFDSAFNEAFGPVIRPAAPEPPELEERVFPHSHEGQGILTSIRRHFSMPEDTPASTIQDFLGHNPELLRSLLQYKVPQPHWQFWSPVGELHEVNIFDAGARAGRMLIMRGIWRLEWTNKDIIGALDDVRKFEETDENQEVKLMMTERMLLKRFPNKKPPCFVLRQLAEGNEQTMTVMGNWAEYVQKRKKRSGSLLVNEVLLED